MGAKWGSKRLAFYPHLYFYASSPNVVLTSPGITKVQFPKAFGRLERVNFPQLGAANDFKKLGDYEVLSLTPEAFLGTTIHNNA